MARLHRYWLFIDSIAASDDSKLSKLTKPKPRLSPVSGSRMICYAHATVVLSPGKPRVEDDAEGWWYLGGCDDDAKGGEGVVEQLLVDLGVEVADEEVGAHVHGLAVALGLVDAQRLAVELDHVHDLDGVLGVLLGGELDEAIALVQVREFVLGDVHVHCPPPFYQLNQCF